MRTCVIFTIIIGLNLNMSMANQEGTVMNLLQMMTKLRDVPNEEKLKFVNAKSDIQRVEMAYGFLKTLDILPSSCKDVGEGGKSRGVSVTLRLAGNKKYSLSMLEAALELYTRSLAMAPVGSAEFALALSNRSAVLLELGEREACLADVRRAEQMELTDKVKTKLLARKRSCELLAADDEMKNKAPDQNLCVNDDSLTAKNTINTTDELSVTETELSTAMKQLNSGSADSSKLLMPGSKLPVVASNEPQLSYRAHKTLHGAAECIDVKRSEQMGRYVEATSNIKPGDVILTEDAFASVLWRDHCYTHCYHCLRPNPALIPCRTCSMVMYCGEECRVASWRASHHVECAVLPALLHINSADRGWLALIALRTLLVALDGDAKLDTLEAADRHVHGFDKAGRFTQDRYTMIHHLPRHNTAANDNAALAVLAACITDLLA